MSVKEWAIKYRKLVGGILAAVLTAICAPLFVWWLTKPPPPEPDLVITDVLFENLLSKDRNKLPWLGAEATASVTVVNGGDANAEDCVARMYATKVTQATQTETSEK